MSELTAEEKQRKGLRGLFRFLKRRDSEAALREAIEEFIEESETTDDQAATGESSLLLNILKLGEKTAYDVMTPRVDRSEEHTSELQSPCKLVCRLLLEKKNSVERGRAARRSAAPATRRRVLS